MRLAQFEEANFGFIFIKSLNGNVRTSFYHPDMTVYDLKEHLNDITDIKSDQMRLIYAGKNMQDDNKLSEYDVKPDSTIHLVLRVSGC